MAGATRVLIVDDSRTFRAVLGSALAGEEDVVVAGSVYSGEKALRVLHADPPDLVTLDVEMPGLNGVETLLEIQRFNATRPPGGEVGVIMVSAYTRSGADVTMKALSAGAFDFVLKPSGGTEAENLAALRQQLLPKIRAWAGRRRAGLRPAAAAPPRPRPSGLKRPVRAVLIAVSTGGPRALETVLPELARRVEVPVLIVQHMPAAFTASLADTLARCTGRPVVEAGDNEPLAPGTTYVAPGGKHLVLRGDAARLRAGLNEQPPENGLRPSADVLFRSAAAVLGGGAVAVVLTGMGCDGTAGLGPLKRAGAHVIAQDEATSVVWGMPGSAVQAGLADEVLPLDRIAAAVQAVVAARGS
jgi:two-component system, chemotaxis family, protein-glutamate methylesterase/glutaminase